MPHRRGTKQNPFELGEVVWVASVGVLGVVTKVIHPKARGWIRYEVEYTRPAVQMRQEFSLVSLMGQDEE